MSNLEGRSDRSTVLGSGTSDEVPLGPYFSYLFRQTPRRVLYSLAYYKFAAKIIGKKKRVLDLGCNEGLGTRLIGNECGFARGVDLDEEAINAARVNWQDDNVEFVRSNFLEEAHGEWDAVINFDVIEHILPEHVSRFWSFVTSSLKHDGVAIIGTPSLNGQQYSSDASKAGHVNVYSHERLQAEMRQHFGHVFLFAGNDEVVHTGFFPMAHYFIALGCRKRG